MRPTSLSAMATSIFTSRITQKKMQRGFGGPDQCDRQRHGNDRPKDRMHPQGRVQVKLGPERHAHHDRAQNEDHQGGRAIASIALPRIETAMLATFAYFEDFMEQTTLAASWTAASQRRFHDRRLGLCHSAAIVPAPYQ